MSEPLKIYENILWSLLDEGSQLYILNILMESGFKGETKIISKIDGDTTIMTVNDKFGHELELPINILDILND